MNERRQKEDNGLEICWYLTCRAIRVDSETDSWLSPNENPEMYRKILMSYEDDRRMPTIFCPEHKDKIAELRPLGEEERNALMSEICKELQKENKK